MNHKPKFIFTSFVSFIFYNLIVLTGFISYITYVAGGYAILGFIVFSPFIMLVVLGMGLISILIGWINSKLYLLNNKFEQPFKMFYFYLLSSAILMSILCLPIILGLVVIDWFIAAALIGAIITNFVAIKISTKNETTSLQEAS